MSLSSALGALLPHRQRAMHLYRRALKTCLDWSGSRQQWYARARAIRAEFEANRRVDNREAAERLLTHGEALLSEWRYPDPLVPPYYVGGTAFSRNPPMPKEVKIVLDFGREPEVIPPGAAEHYDHGHGHDDHHGAAAHHH